MIRRSVIVLLCCCGSSAHALEPSATAIVAQLKKQYTQIANQLKEAKAANDTLRDVYEVSGQVYDEYKFITDFSIESEVRNIVGDVDGLTEVDQLGQYDTEGKFRVLRSEINRRFDNEPDNKEVLLNRITELERLEQLKQKKLKEAELAGSGKMNSKNLSASIASSNALLTALRLEEEQRRKKELLDRSTKASQAKAYEDGFIDFLKSNGNE